VSRDEVRRQMAASQRDHAESLPRMREALKRLFDPDRPRNAETESLKHTLLGAPSRRAFLAVGGATAVGSAILVGCGQPPQNQLAQTGTTPQQPSSTTTTDPGSPDMDVTLLRTSSSIEVLAIDTYQKVLGQSGLVTTPGVRDALELFQSQHQDHANLLYAATTGIGAEPYKKANPYLKYEVVDPTLVTTKTEDQVVTLAEGLENTAAQTYVQAAGVLTQPSLRAAIMSIGATEARHLTLLYLLEQMVPVPLDIFSTAKAAPPDSYITAKGPVKPNDLLPTPTTAGSS
jgi:rubrerythrin